MGRDPETTAECQKLIITTVQWNMEKKTKIRLFIVHLNKVIITRNVHTQTRILSAIQLSQDEAKKKV